MYLSIWALSIIIWIFYSVFAYIFHKTDRESLWTFNFIIRVVMALFVILHTTLFYLSYRRIAKVQETLTHEAN